MRGSVRVAGIRDRWRRLLHDVAVEQGSGVWRLGRRPALDGLRGVAILLAHPRLYWGETGTLGTPSVVDLPLPMVLTGQTGWGRSLHFLAAWVIVLSGVSYVAAGLPRRYFRWPDYQPLQRRTYLVVVFALAPLAVWTGLAMSPAVESVMPSLVTLLGGHQSARTLHFIAASLITIFVVGHIVMVAISGFRARWLTRSAAR